MREVRLLVHMGAEEDGAVVEEGLKGVVAADFGGKGTADEGGVALGVAIGETVELVDEEDGLVLIIAMGGEGKGDIAGFEEGDDFGDTVGMARGEDKGPEVKETVEEEGLFGGVGGGEGNGVRDAGKGGVEDVGQDIEFEEACDVEAGGIGHKRCKAGEVRFRLEEELIKIAEEAARKARKTGKAGSGAGGEFARDKRDAGARGFKGAKEVGPNIAFNEEKAVGFEAADKARHIPRKIEWEKGDEGSSSKEGLRCREARCGSGGDDKLLARKGTHEAIDERAGALDFADGGGVDPEGATLRCGHLKAQAREEVGIAPPKEIGEAR